jgi:hypothetical protein
VSKARRVARAIKHQKHKDEQRRKRSVWEPTCRRCGEKGSHFVPPCFGDIGFYICDPPEDLRNYTRWPLGTVPGDVLP